MGHFFIRRPIVAIVISILIVMIGAASGIMISFTVGSLATGVRRFAHVL